MREDVYKLEEYFLSPYAVKSKDTKGREMPVTPCKLRTDFQRDRDRIIHSKAFRRLKHKTQVFISPEGDHFRTRLTHTLEVSQIARTIARGLRLNEDLTEAIALGHDLGHTPFGHTGERVLASCAENGFSHNQQSLRVVEKLENDGAGLNLTYEVRNGILNHRLSGNPTTLEGKVVALSDKIAYINHDIDDAIVAKLIRPDMLPKEVVKVLGNTREKRINTLVYDVVDSSLDGKVAMSSEIEDAMMHLRAFLFEHLYEKNKKTEQEIKAAAVVKLLFERYKNDPDLLPEFNKKFLSFESLDVVVCDYIAGMSDGFAMKAAGIDISPSV